ncbi:MAG: hypothetical protein J7500_02145 [Sphingomonas sp.]|uniref:ABC-three component system middle component 6 n=1 Tax=Sphingomonas sp. TaxID=28214 RepID=UPI001B227F57|nr:ABC-three component system middle component 6 [Sphingomonas sp.]MBO9621492.1 hypothetical protein [Sphingomonas sp.]
MILPDKHLDENRALLGVGADILKGLDNPSTVSEVWERFSAIRRQNATTQPISFDWFAQALTFLFAIHAIRVKDGLIERGVAA